jgi:5-methyltetrahydrofolate--homocysteine methyltransferase
MPRSLNQLLAGGPVVCDGAMGTLLQASGKLDAGGVPEELNLSHPDVVRNAHLAYVAAGSHIIETNSFGGSRIRLGKSGFGEQVVEINEAAARLAREAAGDSVLVAGSMGPMGEMVDPWGPISFTKARDVFAEQAEALARGGVDLFIIETMFDLEEMRAAIEGAHSVTALPLVCTMTFDQGGRTMMGTRPDTAANALLGMGADLIGSNCGRGPSETEAAVRMMMQACPEATFVAQPNAGVPRLENGKATFDATPEDMARYAKTYVEMGVRILGGCCGSTPAHIKAIAAAVRSLKVA